MPTMRTAPKAVEEIKAKDPLTPITLAALHQWIKKGKVVSVKLGRINLVNMESLENFLNGIS